MCEEPALLGTLEGLSSCGIERVKHRGQSLLKAFQGKETGARLGLKFPSR